MIDTTLPGCLRGDPAPADRVRHIERAVHDDVGDRIEAARRQVLGARDEIAGGVVDEVGERALGENRLDHLVDRERVADVDAVAHHPAAIEVHQFGRGFVADALAAAADMHLGAELEEARGHRFAEPGAAAGDENAPPREKLFVEHVWFPPKGIVC